MAKNDPKSWTYEEALENFDQFCDYFDATAASHYRRHSEATEEHRRGLTDTSDCAATSIVDVPSTRTEGTSEDC